MQYYERGETVIQRGEKGIKGSVMIDLDCQLKTPGYSEHKLEYYFDPKWPVVVSMEHFLNWLLMWAGATYFG